MEEEGEVVGSHHQKVETSCFVDSFERSLEQQPLEGYQKENVKFQQVEKNSHHVCVTYNSNEKQDENIETDEHAHILDMEHQENNANYDDGNSLPLCYATFHVLKEIHDNSLPLCYATF